MFSGSNTCDTILSIPIHHTIIQFKRVLPSFPETTKDTVNMVLFISCPCMCIIQINILPFCSICPQEKPSQLLDRNNTEARKKKILCCKVRPLVSISEMRQKKFFIAVCISGIWDLLYIHLSHTGNPIKLLAFSAIQNIAVLSFFFFNSIFTAQITCMLCYSPLPVAALPSGTIRYLSKK